MKIKKRKSLKTTKINLDRRKKTINRKMKKVKKKSVIPYDLVNNAYASLILPRLKRL